MPPNLLHSVQLRLLEALQTIALCESWLAQFGPGEEKGEHQGRADEANEKAKRIAGRIGDA